MSIRYLDYALVFDSYVALLTEDRSIVCLLGLIVGYLPSPPVQTSSLSTAAAAVQHSMQYKSLPPSMQQALQHKIYDAILVSGYTVS